MTVDRITATSKTPDFLVGIDNGHPVLVPAGRDISGLTGTEMLNPTELASTRSLVSGARSDPWGADMSWLLPTHVPILTPERQTAFATVTQTGLITSYDAASGERGRGAIKLQRTAVNTTSQAATMSFPAGTEFASTPVMVGPTVHVRVKCDDWSQVQRFYIGFTKPGDLNSYRYFKIVEANASDFGMTDPNQAAAWNGKWRTLVLTMDRQMAPVGTPNAWSVDAPWHAAGGMIFTVNQKSAATGFTILIDRIYCPKWPVGFVSLILDGAYKSARDLILPAFNQRNWKCGMSANRVDGSTSGVTTYPTFADLAAAAAMGHDVFQHGHFLSGSTPIPLDATAGQTEAAVLDVLTRQREVLLSQLPPGARGPRWIQWLTNNGKYFGGRDMAKLVRDFGVDAGRANCSDAEFGYDYTAGPYTTSWSSDYTASGANCEGWVARRGRYNRMYTDFQAAAPGPSTSTPESRDTYAGNGLQGGVKFAANCANGIHTYVHNILPYDGTNPTSLDSGTNLWRDFLADVDDKVAAGSLMVLSPTQVERLTYWRQGDVYLSWDGEWRRRSDGSIAF